MTNIKTPVRALRNEKGFTLVEVLIASLILGMIVLVYSSLEVFTSQAVKKASEFSIGQKVLLSITNDVLTSEKGLPPNNPPPELAKASFTRTELEFAFKNLDSKVASESVLRKICYDSRANLITEAKFMPNCYYNVAYLKYRHDDLRFKGRDKMDQIPLSRVLIRVTYPDVDFKPAPGQPPRMTTRYMTRLVSNVAEF